MRTLQGSNFNGEIYYLLKTLNDITRTIMLAFNNEIEENASFIISINSLIENYCLTDALLLLAETLKLYSVCTTLVSSVY